MLTELEKKFMIGAYICKDSSYMCSLCENLARTIDVSEIKECIDFYYEHYNEYNAHCIVSLQMEGTIDEKKLSDAEDAIVRFRTGTATEADVSYIQDINNLNVWKNSTKPVSWKDYVGSDYKVFECRNSLHSVFETDGFKSKNLYIIGGYTGSGKSLLCLNILMQLKDDANAVYFNMENSNIETLRRLNGFKASPFAPYCHDFDIIDGIKTLDEIISDIKEYNYDFVVIDQLSMLNINADADNLRIKYKDTCQKLAELARELDICIIMSCQLNRNYMSSFKEAKDDSAWRTTFSELDDTAFAESSDITRPSQAVVITTIHTCEDFKYPYCWMVNVKQRSGNAIKCQYHAIKRSVYETGKIYKE